MCRRMVASTPALWVSGNSIILVVEDEWKACGTRSVEGAGKELGYDVLEAKRPPPMALRLLMISILRSASCWSDAVMPEVNGRMLADRSTPAATGPKGAVYDRLHA